ncbi:aminomethyltransferase [uncultured Gammaproteobacteria bacterium]
MSQAPADIRKTALNDLHRELQARLVPFAGYDLPLHFAPGILKEHLHTRAQAGLFDVSHMGQIRLHGKGAAAALESLVPGELLGLPLYCTRYTLLLNEAGGIIDDLMVTNAGDHLFLVVNAARIEADLAFLRAMLPEEIEIEPLTERSLIALQGPAAAEVMARHVPMAGLMRFMTQMSATLAGKPVLISRSGYTGEDGYEISVTDRDAETVARALLSEPEVEPVGLGARDSLRLEAGLCLYGQDIDETTTPVEAGLAWTIGKRRRAERGFPGVAVLLYQLEHGAPRRRVGIHPNGRAPAREETPIVNSTGVSIGKVTSGGFGPSVNGPVAMGYVSTGYAATGTPLILTVRGRPLAARVCELPFIPNNFYRG